MQAKCGLSWEWSLLGGGFDILKETSVSEAGKFKNPENGLQVLG